MSYTTGYRVQAADRNAQELLDPDMCFTIDWNNGSEQEGISVCYSLDDLAEYLATKGECIPVEADTWVIVKLSGDELDETGHDDEMLLRPDEIHSVTPVTQDWIDEIDALRA